LELGSITQPFKNALAGIQNGIQNVFGSKEKKPVHIDDLVDFVNAEYTRRMTERRIFELQWRLNLAMYEGNQYLDINTATMSLEEMPILYDWQEREVFNHIAPNIETRISKLKKVRTILKVRPGTSDLEDVHSAKVGGHILKNNYNDQNLRDKQAEEIMWSELCGTVFRKHVWNPNLGRVIGVDQGAPNEETGEPGQQVEIREGEQEFIVCPAQEILPDSSSASDVTKCKSLMHCKAFATEDIINIWGVEVAPEKVEVEKLIKSTHGMGGLGFGFGYGQGGFMVHNVKLEKHAIVKEYWEIPTKKYPEGRLIIVAGGKLLYAGKLPYLVGDDNKPGIPFTMLVCLKRPGLFWGKTVLERLIPVQRRYNALRNRKAEYLNRAAIGQYDIEVDSIDDMDAFEADAGMPGSITEYNRGTRKPTLRETPPLPRAFDTEEQTLLNEFAILSGVSEISRQSMAPAGVKSGVALSIVQEQDDTRISNTVENIERYNVASGKIQLRLSKQYVKAPRTIHAVGRNNVVEVIDWMGTDIRSEDVYLDNMSALADSPAQKRQMVFDLLESGLLRDPETGQINSEMRSKVFEMIEMGEWESADDESQLHLAKAERENRMLSQGQFTQAVDYDDHISHISRHNRFRLTVDYEEMKAQNPVLEEIFDAHVNMHLMVLNQRAMMAAQMQQQEEPKPGGSENAA
jgi:hypothetical protein